MSERQKTSSNFHRHLTSHHSRFLTLDAVPTRNPNGLNHDASVKYTRGVQKSVTFDQYGRYSSKLTGQWTRNFGNSNSLTETDSPSVKRWLFMPKTFLTHTAHISVLFYLLLSHLYHS